MRLSVGTEETEDLLADLEHALAVGPRPPLVPPRAGLGRSGPAAPGRGARVSRLQHLGWFFSSGFRPQAWGRPEHRWGYRWQEPRLYQHSVRELEQAGLDLVVMEDAVSLGNADTLDLRVRAAYGGPKHDPLLLAPVPVRGDVADRPRARPSTPGSPRRTWPRARPRRCTTCPAGGSGSTWSPTSAAPGTSAREPLDHDAAYDRAEEWTDVVRRLWHSWGPGALVADEATGRYADGSLVDAFQHRGAYFEVDGPAQRGAVRGRRRPGRRLPRRVPARARPTPARTPTSSSPWPRWTRAASAPTGRKVHEAAVAAGRRPQDVKVLFVLKPEVVASPDEARRVVAASLDPDEDALLAVAAAWSSDLETDLTRLPLDAPLTEDTFGDHVSRGTVRGLLGKEGQLGVDPLRVLLARKARKGLLADRSGLVGTAQELAGFVEEMGEEADNDGFLLSGDLHPVTVHRMLDDLVPELRRRGVLRDELGDGGLRANLVRLLRTGVDRPPRWVVQAS